MRVLVVASAGTGHVFPLVPESWALRSAGHDVLIASAGDGVERAASAGLTAVDVAPSVDMYEVLQSVGQAAGGWGPSPTPAAARERAVQLFTRVSEVMRAGTENVARRWRPNVVLLGELQGAAAVVAARLGVPAVEHAIGLAGDGTAFVAEIWPRLAAGPVVDPVAIIRIAPPSLAPGAASGRWTMRPVPYKGGAGSTLSAPAAGVAQVVVPQGADQFLNAASVSQRGCAVTADLAPEAIRDGLRRALSGEFAARLAEHLTR